MNKENLYKNKDWLEGKYLGDKMSIAEIAALCGADKQTIWRNLIKHGIPRRLATEHRIGKKWSLETRRKMSLSAVKRSQRPEYREKQRCSHLGIKHSEQTKRKLSLIRRGREHPWAKGVSRPAEVREKVSLTLKGRYQDREFKERAIKALMQNRDYLPAPDELRIISLCKKHQLPFKYIGDGKVIIAGKVPDFIHTGEKKLLIEIYGRRDTKYEQRRISIFSPLGFKTLFLTRKDLRGKDWEAMCLRKIKSFEGG